MSSQTPMPADELSRIITLSEFDLDYGDLSENFKDLTRLAAKVAGTEISLVNLIDSLTQWTVSSHGLALDQIPREESVCQYTIAQPDQFEVPDLSADDRFKDRFYVSGELGLRYYYGVPLNTEGQNIGALCVLDTETHLLSPEKIELLKIIADEIVNRLKTLKVIGSLRSQMLEASESQRRVAHDIRGPLGGIIGLARIISEQGDENTMEEVLEFINLIHKSGNSILELADEILTTDKKTADLQEQLSSNEFNLMVLKDKLVKLYAPQALNKQIGFDVIITPETQTVPFSKNKLLQIIGNLVSNAIKFTPAGGKVSVDLQLIVSLDHKTLQLMVTDTGVGISAEKISQIMQGTGESTTGTGGEQGYGFGLALVKHLTESLKGTMEITSGQNVGTTFKLQLPQYISR